MICRRLYAVSYIWYRLRLLQYSKSDGLFLLRVYVVYVVRPSVCLSITQC